MGILNFKRRKKKTSDSGIVQIAPSQGAGHPFKNFLSYMPLQRNEMKLYDSLRESIPVIDAAISKIIRLTGGVSVICRDMRVQSAMDDFLSNVKVNGSSKGIYSFLGTYLDQLLTYGTAVGEIVTNKRGEVAALYNAPLEDIELKSNGSPLDISVCTHQFGQANPVINQELILLSALDPKPGEVYGNSILKGLPFVSEILLKIYNSISLNWERAGNIRYSVTYKPSGDNDRNAKERARQIAEEWSKAMKKGAEISDFVAVGDVSIKVIGADNKVLDSEIPVRQMLEQIVAKLSIPPFLLGLSWSTTERMSSQQADILTSELEYYRYILTPVVSKICNVWLRSKGFESGFEICWNDINLQDEVETANARHINAQAQALEIENEKAMNSKNENGKGDNEA